MLTMNIEKGIKNVEEVAEYLRKSTSWVYKNWKIIGGRKLGGSLIFPSEEDLYERLFFQQEKQVAVRVHRKRNSVHGNLVPKEIGSERSRSKKKGGDKEPEADDGNPNRHRLFRTGQ